MPIPILGLNYEAAGWYTGPASSRIRLKEENNEVWLSESYIVLATLKQATKLGVMVAPDRT